MIIQLFNVEGPSIEAPTDADQRVAATLAIMSAMVAMSKTVTYFARTSRMLYGGVAPQKTAVLMFDWLRRSTRFEEDPPGVELIRAPWEMLEAITKAGPQLGDCDDRATLAASIMHCAGHEVGFIVCSRKASPNPFRHVLACIFTPDGQHAIPIDPQHAQAAGMLPEGVERVGFYRIV